MLPLLRSDGLLIPQDQLEARLDEIPRGKPLAVFCNTGLRSYESQVMLRQKGFTDLLNVQGGHGLLRMMAPGYTEDSDQS